MSNFTLLTFNTFAILNWDTPFRVTALAQELRKLAPDIICLQEIHSHAFRRTLESALPNYADAIHAPMLGRPRGGVITLSCLPILRDSYVLYTEQGAWMGLSIMDRMLGKGMLISHHLINGLPIIVLNTHIMANYGLNYARTGAVALRQVAQLHQLVETVKALPAEALVIAVGDFNLPRGSWLCEEFLQQSGLEDTLTGDTRPSYRPLPGVPSRYALPIDFVFVRRPQHTNLQIASHYCFDHPVRLVGNYANFLSDHLGILTNFTWPDAPPSPSNSVMP